MTGYNYYKAAKGGRRTRGVELEAYVALGRARLYPRLSDPNYLVHRVRARIVREWFQQLGQGPLDVLGVGSRIQVYRPLLGQRVRQHISIDPQIEGLVDVVGAGEHLPFPDASFDLVICTQVLSYVDDPGRVVTEIHRVLRVGGRLLLTAPALFPRHHDERWRFLPDGLRILLKDYSDVVIRPEGCSISGAFRTANVCLGAFVGNGLLRWLLSMTVIPMFNLAGRFLDGLSLGNDQLTTNYSVLARR